MPQVSPISATSCQTGHITVYGAVTEGNVLHTDLRFRRTWFLMRPSMAAIPRRRSGLTACAEAQRDVEVVGHGEHVGGGLPVEPGAHDRGETPGRRGLRRARRRTGARCGRARPRPRRPGTAATGTRGPAPSCRPRRRSAPGSSGSSRGQLEQQLQPLLRRRRRAKSSTSSASGAGSVTPIPVLAPFRALGDRHPHGVAPLGPGAVVVADVAEAEQVGEHEPGVAGALADAAVGDDVVVGREALLGEVDGLELGARLERAVLGGRPRPRHAGRAGDVAAAQRAFLRVVGHVQQLAGVLAGRADVDQRLAAAGARARPSRKARIVRVVALDDRVLVARLRLGRLGGQLAALGLPLGPAAVEDPHVGWPNREKTQKRVGGPPVVLVAVEDDRGVVADAALAAASRRSGRRRRSRG